MQKSPTKAKNPADLLKILKDNDVEYVDFWFTDSTGKRHHISQHVSTVDKDMIANGIYFDGSSISGWKEINESDMTLMPDLDRITLDPFAAQPTLKLFCDVIEPRDDKSYNRDPRSIAKRAEAYMKKTKIADSCSFGPEAEFFVFDDVRIATDPHQVAFQVDSPEGTYNSGREYMDGNMGHRPGHKGGYLPDAPIDTGSDLRAEMLTVMAECGLEVEKHHHEVAPAQHELGIKHNSLVACADNVQLYKYIVLNVANAYGKTATFMPKPMFGDNGSGMHVHQSLWKDGKPLFAGKGYAGLSDKCLYYIGGIIKHARAINAFTNPTTNSYKRLVPGYEAPVLLAYSGRNRSASCRIPMAKSDAARRVEVRFPDPTANPYLAFSAMLMAGLDGIKNKIHPGDPMDENLYELPKSKLLKIPHVCRSLREALESLAKDHAFLLEGDVFNKDMIEAYIDLKMTEVERFEMTPHPVEYDMYYSA